MKFRIECLVLILAVALDIPAYAKGSEVEALSRQAVQFAQQGRYEQAIDVEEKARKLAEGERKPDQHIIGLVLGNLGQFYFSQGQIDHAESFYKQALAIQENLGGADSAQSLIGLGNLAIYKGQYAEAEPLLKRALSLREKTMEAGDRSIADSLTALATLYKLEVQYEQAEAPAEWCDMPVTACGHFRSFARPSNLMARVQFFAKYVL